MKAAPQTTKTRQRQQPSGYVKDSLDQCTEAASSVYAVYHRRDFCNVEMKEESIMISKWPEYKDEWNFEEDEKAVESIKEAVRGIRSTRTGMNVPPSRKAKVFVVSESEEVNNIFENSKAFFATLGYAGAKSQFSLIRQVSLKMLYLGTDPSGSSLQCRYGILWTSTKRFNV